MPTKSGKMMLKQTEYAETPAPNAAQARVTPEELAAAISHLEAGSAGRDGKIAIGKAVEELSLDAAPEDILRVVEAARQQTARRRASRRRGLAALLAGLAAVGGLGVWVFERLPRAVPAAPIVAAPGGTLAALKDEQSAYVDTRGLKQIVERITPSQIQVYPHNKGVRWGVIKHGGTVYVQAYSLQTTEQRLRENKTVDIPLEEGNTIALRNAEDADITGGEKGYIVFSQTVRVPDSKLTLPIHAFQYHDSQQSENQAKITVSDIRPDDHLWDSFEHKH